jgi:hypothetical protein
MGWYFNLTGGYQQLGAAWRLRGLGVLRGFTTCAIAPIYNTLNPTDFEWIPSFFHHHNIQEW